MSAIYFHTPGGTATVRGSERTLAGSFAKHALEYALRLPGIDIPSMPHPMHKLLTPKAREYSKLISLTELLSSEGFIGNELVTMSNKPVDLWTTGLNTGLILAAPAMKLLLRVHGTCELHSFIQGTHRAWLATLIQEGLAQRVLSAGAGWDSVAELCLQSSFEPVVLSYSACEQFPNRHAALRGGWVQEPKDPEGELWYKLSIKERWSTAWRGLEKEADSLEWRPSRWDQFRFEDGLDGFELYQHAVARAAL